MRWLTQKVPFFVWALVLGIVGLSIAAAAAQPTHCYFTDQEASTGNVLMAWVSQVWKQTTQADFTTGVASNVDLTTSSGDVLLAKPSSAQLYGAPGGGTRTFWHYDSTTNAWASAANATGTLGDRSSLAYDGNRYVYCLQGGGTGCWRYDTITDTWASLPAVPAAVGIGGSIAYDGSRYLYALRGNTQATFWRYDATLGLTGTWTAMTGAPATIRTGGALVAGAAGYLYAFRGGATTFYRYNVSSNNWSTMTAAPGATGVGAALAYDGSTYIYALRGGSQTSFYRYSISGNSWSTMASSTPYVVAAGGALTYDGSGGLYALLGNSTAYLYRYDVAGAAWTQKTSALANVTTGGTLGATLQNLYAPSGTLASAVFDTAVSGAKIDALAFDKTLPAGTAISLEVRASNTSFAAGAASPTWVAVSGSTPVSPVTGRYVQWRATLTTSNRLSATPMLSEVRLYYH